MKRLIDFSTISLSILLLSTSGAKALENNSQVKTPESLSQSIVIAQAEENSEFITLNENTTKGTLNIVEEDGKQYIELSDDFQTAEGPDLEIILHKDNAVPLNIESENYVAIAPIQGLEGTQRYEVPQNIDINDYASVAVWCQEFNITFGYAQL